MHTCMHAHTHPQMHSQTHAQLIEDVGDKVYRRANHDNVSHPLYFLLFQEDITQQSAPCRQTGSGCNLLMSASRLEVI